MRLNKLGVVFFLVCLSSTAAAYEFVLSPVPPGVKVYEDLPYVTGGHERQKLDIYVSEKTKHPQPLIIWIHGGGWAGGDKTTIRDTDYSPVLPQGYLQNGYIVASVGYRLSQHARFPAQIEDCKAAIRWLRAHARRYHIDPERIGVIGRSAGGHLVALLGTTGAIRTFDVGENLQFSSRVQTVVDYFGPTDFSQSIVSDPRAQAATTQAYVDLIGGLLADNPQAVQRANPITYVAPGAPPFVILHGDADPGVPAQQSQLLFEALRGAKVPVHFITVRGGGHGEGFPGALLNPIVADFFARQLQGRPDTNQQPPAIQSEVIAARSVSNASTPAAAESKVQPPVDALSVVTEIEDRYFQVRDDITYSTVNGYESKLDAYVPRSDGLHPTVILFHGSGTRKTTAHMRLLSYLQRGWTGINVEYRSSDGMLSPAAVEDGLCALRWVARNAKQYKIDLDQIVITGHSAGGHLALTTGMIPETSPLAQTCMFEGKVDRSPLPKVAAIVNWFGVADVAGLMKDPPDSIKAAVKWLGSQPNRLELAAAVSPLSYVRTQLPPIVTVHGTKDPLVPYAQSIRLHQALDAAKVKNSLITIPDGGHAFFGFTATRDAYRQIFEFLVAAGVSVDPIKTP